MISTITITIFLVLLRLLFAVFLVLPSVSLPTGFSTAWATLITWVNPFYTILPVADLVICIGIYMSFELVFNSYKLVVFVYKRIKS